METDRGAAVNSRVDLQKILREKVDVRAGGQKKPWVSRCPEVGSGGRGKMLRRSRMPQPGYEEKSQTWTELSSASELPRLCDSQPHFLIAQSIPQ